MKQVQANITISKNSNNEIHIEVQDSTSRILIVEAKLTLEDFAQAITGLAHIPVYAVVSELAQHIGKTKIMEQRTATCPISSYKRKELEEWLVENCQEDGWYLDTYLGSQGSIHGCMGSGNTSNNLTLLSYKVYKYV